MRELRDLLEQVVIVHDGPDISGAALPLLVGASTAAPAEAGGFALPEGGLDLDEVERSLALQALERTGWNTTRAGRLLGLSRDAMRYRAEKYGLRLEQEPDGG